MIIDYRPVNLEDSLVDYPDHLELPVVMQREMTTYLHRSLPMCIMLTNDNYRGWFNTNFVQIFHCMFLASCPLQPREVEILPPSHDGTVRPSIRNITAAIIKIKCNC